MMETILRIAQVAAVIALLCFAAALATPPGRLPLALRGLQKILHKDGKVNAPPSAKASPTRRFFAFLLVLAAIALALW